MSTSRQWQADPVPSARARAQRSADRLDRRTDRRPYVLGQLRQGRRQRRPPVRRGRGWFGPDAGASGTRHTVALEKRGADWHLSPLGQRAGELQLWRAYSREEIPPLFGLEFSTAIWNVGFVKRPGHICLLVTLDKAGHGEDFQYKDHFSSPAEFEWQSQNRTGQSSADGQDIQNHAARGIAVHLFVRSQKKRAGGGAAPFVYCEDVWRGEKPITVQWTVPEAVPARLRGDLGVPDVPRQRA